MKWINEAYETLTRTPEVPRAKPPRRPADPRPTSPDPGHKTKRFWSSPVVSFTILVLALVLFGLAYAAFSGAFYSGKPSFSIQEIT